MRIGVDLDNTIVCYDDVFRRRAVALGLVSDDWPKDGDRLRLRQAIRALPDGETQWQRLQGWVYGRGMAEARPFPGLDQVLDVARQRHDQLFIVSHRTLRPHFDPDGPDLHQAALSWLGRWGYLGPHAPWSDERVFLETSRDAKIARLIALELDLFIDDLAEVLEDPAFPASVRGLHFRPDPGWSALAQGIWP